MTTEAVQPEATPSDPASEALNEFVDQEKMAFSEVMSDRYDIVAAENDPRFGSYVVLAERQAVSTLAEFGSASPSPWTNWTREEWVGKLRDRDGLVQYYRMKRSDGAVRGALRLLKTPIQSARWFIKPASDSTRDKNVAKFIEKNLFEELNVSWSKVLDDVLLMCDYGYIAMEKVYKLGDDGKIHYQKLAPRHPLDVREWRYDVNGGPNGVLMEPLEFDESQTPIFIPIDKLAVFSLEAEAGDLRGISVLRSAYKHWYYKDCASADTEIMTRSGWKTHDQLQDGEEVMTLNLETGLSEWCAVEYIRRYEGVHDMISMESQVISMLVTPDHRWPVKDDTWAEPYHWETSQTLRQRHIVPRGAENAQLPTVAKYEDDFVALAGWFTTEGSWSSYGARIGQDYGPGANEIRSILTRLFGPAYTPSATSQGRRDLAAGWYEKSNSANSKHCFFFLNAAAAKLLRTVSDADKVIDLEFIQVLTRAQLELYIRTCLAGDGCSTQEIRQSHEAGRRRLASIELANILLGRATNMHYLTKSDVWQLTWSNRVGCKPVQAAARHPESARFVPFTYVGTIWCPKTKNGTWLARRNGKVCYTGNTLYKIDAIQKERHGIGVPVIILPVNYSDADKAAADQLGRNLRTNERAHVVLPPNWTLTFAEIKGQPVDCLKSINHHNMQIFSNVLAPFAENANGIQSDASDLFMKSTRYIASTVADVFNKFIIQPLVDMNWSRVGYPCLVARRMGEWDDARTQSFAVRNYIGSGVITPDDELEKAAREFLDLPPADPDTARIVRTPQVDLTAAQKNEAPGQPLIPSDQPVAGQDTNAPTQPKPPRVGAPRQSASAPVGSGSTRTGLDRSGKSGTR